MQVPHPKWFNTTQYLSFPTQVKLKIISKCFWKPVLVTIGIIEKKICYAWHQLLYELGYFSFNILDNIEEDIPNEDLWMYTLLGIFIFVSYIPNKYSAMLLLLFQ